MSTLKNGRRVILPPVLNHGLACQVMMMQAEGKGEALSLQMRVIGNAVTFRTSFEDKISINSPLQLGMLDV